MNRYFKAGRKAARARIIEKPKCAERREGDEMACRCGKRWPVGEQHP